MNVAAAIEALDRILTISGEVERVLASVLDDETPAADAPAEQPRIDTGD